MQSPYEGRQKMNNVTRRNAERAQARTTNGEEHHFPLPAQVMIESHTAFLRRKAQTVIDSQRPFIEPRRGQSGHVYRI